MRRIVSLLICCLMVFSGTCCIVPTLPKPLVRLTAPMKKRIWIDASFSEAEVENIITAYKTIECSTNYSLVNFEFTRNATISDLQLMVTEPSIVVVNTTSADPRIKESDKDIKPMQTIGLYLKYKLPTVLIVKDRIKNNDTLFYRVALHEAIHSSFNIMPHSSSTEAIMFKSLSDSSAQDISNEDLDFICKYYDCNAVHLNICKGEF